MKSWSLQLRESPPGRVDASPICLSELGESDAGGVAKTGLACDGRRVELGELFRVRTLDATRPTLRIEGDARLFDFVGQRHAYGTLQVIGSVGDHVGCSMSGGVLTVTGSVGDFLAAPRGPHRRGMTGGKIVVRGDAGGRACHRMRRGEVIIGGNAGDALASLMIAGTVAVTGRVGDLTGYGMSRGTIVTVKGDFASRPPSTRFGEPAILRSPFLAVLAKSMNLSAGPHREIRELADSISSGALVRRGDFAVGGQGEWITPLA